MKLPCKQQEFTDVIKVYRYHAVIVKNGITEQFIHKTDTYKI
jgi:hypothetical protein